MSSVESTAGEMVIMASMADHERKIVTEFVHLLEKSKQLFNGLRDLPQYGNKQWQLYFGNTFNVYTKLWKFQQQHRQILDTKYGLKRWQIGEIASKIGQIYYHYYLRTSNTYYLTEAYTFYAAIRGRAYYSRATSEDSLLTSDTYYLSEAFSFYAAIRSRAYYSRIVKEGRSDLMVKKLRYYARFIVVCLLLKKMKLVKELVVELDSQITDYTTTYEPDDQLEWSLVLEEIRAFIKADNVVSVLHADSNTIVISHRLSPLITPPVEKSPIMNLTLQEIIIVGNCNDQVKFSELTIDMFRIVQTLEREPREEYSNLYDSSPGPNRMPVVGCSQDKGYSINAQSSYHMMSVCQENGERPCKKENPHKYTLFRPSLSQIMLFLSAGFRELPASGALLMYISSDGCFSSVKHPENMGYDLGGILTCSKKEPVDTINKKLPHMKDLHCLYPGDLYPFTRRPLFIILDSDNSFVFQHIPRHFGQPLVVLMSPQELPPMFQDQTHNGNLFTLFLHSPLSAFCYICNIFTVPFHLWERCQSFIDRFVTEASRLYTRSRIDHAYLQFFGDDFLRILLLRYIFCDVVLHLHRSFKGRQYRPRCHPPMPDGDLLDHPALQHYVLDLASHLDVRQHFMDTNEID